MREERTAVAARSCFSVRYCGELGLGALLLFFSAARWAARSLPKTRVVAFGPLVLARPFALMCELDWPPFGESFEPMRVEPFAPNVRPLRKLARSVPKLRAAALGPLVLARPLALMCEADWPPKPPRIELIPM